MTDGNVDKGLWKTVLKSAVCLLLLGYVSAAFAIAHRDNGERKCSDINLVIEEHSIPDSVLRQGVRSQLAAYSHPLVGERIGDIDLQGLEDYLSKFSNFEEVECSFDPKSRLTISIMPIKPEVRVFENGKGSFYVNRQGKRIVADAEFYVDVPVLLTSGKDTAHIADALPVIRFVTADDELSALTAAFKIDGPKDILLIPRLQGHVVNFGDSSRLGEKKAALLTAYRRILPVRGWNTYDTLSVKFKDQIVASRRVKPVAPQGIPEDDGEDLEEATLPDIAEIYTPTNKAENHSDHNE